MRHTFLCLLALGLTGCGRVLHGWQPAEITRDELLSKLDEDPGAHVTYLGSDGDYHYLRHSNLKRQSEYRITTQQLPLRDTFDKGDSAPYVLPHWVIEGKSIGTPVPSE